MNRLLPFLQARKLTLLCRCLPPLLLLLTGAGASAQISGVVYRDFNSSGTREIPGEVGTGGVTITITSANGVVTTGTSSTVTSNTATTGTYSITPTGTAPFRVIFAQSTFPAGYFPGPRGTGSGTAVQFIATATQANVNLGINHPADYTQANPGMVTACYVNGDPLLNGTAANTDALVSVPYSATGDAPVETYYAYAKDVGAVWGLAYQRATSKLYSAAFIKRHMGLGTGGSGAIYVTTPGSGTFTSAVHANLDALGFSTGNSTIPARSLPASNTTTSRDALAIFDMVGKAGLGDLEITDDGTQLYTINLLDRKLYRIPANVTPTAGNVASFTLPAPNPTCRTGSTFRPFATKYYRDRVYVGGVCTNEAVTGTTTFTAAAATTSITVPDTTGLKAVVFEFNPATSVFTQVLTAPLTYRKGANNSDKNGVDRADRWFPWNAVTTGERFVRSDGSHSYPQPMLTDIEFDVDGSMILGIRDRFGEQYGNNNLGPDAAVATLRRAIAPGDILRAGKCGPGNLWTLENNGAICGVSATTLTAGNNQGPGGKEYYFGDQVAAGANHIDIGLGGLALIPGRDEVAMTAMDPTDNFDTGGVRRLQNSTGAGSKATAVQIVGASSGPGLFGKGNSLGDLEIISNPAPIEIGNRIWTDGGAVGADGLQGAAATSFSAVTVQLFRAGTLVGTATTNAAGEYYFNTTNVTGGLLPNTAYEIRVPLSQTVITSQNYVLTQANVGSDDEIDSDATTVTGDAVIALTTGDYGSNNHSFDIGFVTCPTITVPSPSQTVCSGTPVGTLRVTTTATGTGVIQFVYFTTPQSGTAVYSGGTSLTTITPVSGSATATNVAFPPNTGTTPVIYYVYARLNPAPGSTDCQPSALIQVTVNPVVSATATSTTITCAAPATVSGTSNIAGSTFAWNGPSGFTSASQSFTTTVPGTYTLIATANGCPGAPVTTVVVSNTVVPSVSLANDGPLTCAKTTVTVSATVTGFASTYNYRFNGGALVTNQSSTTLSFPVSVSGTNTLSVTTTNGCSASATTSVTQNIAPPVVTASNTGPLTCTLTTVTVAASTTTAGATYVWSSGQTTASFTTSTPGVYSVTVTAPNGCTAIASTTVAQDITAPQNVTATNTGPLTCTLTSVTVSASSTTPGAAYRWSSGQTTASFTTSTGGIYSVTVTAPNGCTALTTTTVTSNTVLPTASINSPTICNGTSTTLTASASGGSGFTYLWSTGATTVSITVSPTTTTTYNVTVTNSNGCSVVSSGTVTVNPAVVASVNSPTICSGTSATLTASASGGSGFTYAWSTGATTPSITVAPTSTTAFSVTVTNSNGCSVVSSGTVTVNPSVTATVASQTICAGTSTTLTANASGGTGFTYLWAPAGTGTTQTVTVSPTTTTTYNVTVTNSNGCSVVTSATVTVNPAVTAVIGASPGSTICAGTSATLTASGGTTYRWSTGATTAAIAVSPTSTTAFSVTVTNASGCSAVTAITVTVNPAVVATLSSATICNGTSATLTATGGSSYRLSDGQTNTTGTFAVAPASTTPYSVTVTNAAGCSAIATGSVTVNPAVTATLSSATICNGTSATLTATGGTNYRFSEGTVNTSGTLVVAPTTTTPYSVTVTNTFGCSAVTSATVTVNPAVTLAASISPGTVICQGNSVTFTISGGTNYSFSTGLTNTTGVLVVTPAVTTPYSVTVTNASGCSATGSVTITVNPAVTLTAGASSPTICAGSTTTLTANASGGTGITYAWSNGVTTASQTVSPTLTTTYSVTATNSTGCFSTTSVTITVNPAVTATVANQTICSGTSAVLTANASGGSGFTYLWSTGAATASITVSPTTTTTYSVTITNSTGCSVVSSGTVTVNPAVVASVNSPTICSGTSAVLTASASGGSGFTYAWSTGATTSSITVSPTTTTVYNVTVTNSNGCSVVATGTVTVNPPVVATLSSATICTGTSTTLIATGGTFYRFSDGVTITTNGTGRLVVAPTTVGSNPYSVTVTSAQTCSAIATGSVRVNALPQPVILGSTSVCAGQPISLTATPTSGLTYAWSGPGGNLGSTNPLTIANSTSANSGTYQVLVTDANGCTATASHSVTVKPVPVVQIVNTSIVCENNDPATFIATQVTGGSPPISYAWYRAGAGGVISTDANPTFSDPDVYSLIVTDANGCISNVATVTVVTPNPLAVSTQAINAVCFNGQGQIRVTINGGMAPYTVRYDNTGGLISSTTTSGISTLQTGAGSYTVVISDANGCSLTQTAAITQPPLLAVALTGGGPVCAGQNTGSITSSVTGGTPPYAFSWSTGATTPNLTGLSGGSYSVVVTDANGCVTSQTATLATNPLPAAPTATIIQPTCVTLTGTIQIQTPATGVQYSFDNGQSYQSSPTLAGVQPGSYLLRVKDTVTGCESTATTVTVNAVPSPPTASIAGRTVYCAGEPISLTASPASGVTYAWSGPTGSLGSTNPLLVPTTSSAQSGVYQVTVTDANGCTAVASATITLNAAVTATVNSATITCQTPAPVLTVTSGQPNLTYQWSGPASFAATTQSVTVTATGTYTVVVTDAQTGCSTTATATVAQDFTAPVTTVNNATLTCQNTYAAVTLTATSTGAATYRWTGPTGFTAATASISVATPGTYTVVSTNPQTGCSTTNTATVNQDAGVQATLTQSTCLNNGTSAVAADDYFTVTIQATNTGNTGTYEVVLGAAADGTGGTVLNPGGTVFGTAVTVGGVGQGNAKGFRADGTTTYPLLIRPVGQVACRVFRLTGAVAPCSSCFPIPCQPTLLQKQ